MAVLLVSTYELGHQPIHLASPAAALRSAGVETICLDLSVDDFDPSVLESVDAVAFSVPMHTAMRLAVGAASMVRQLRPDLPVAFYGLYADVGKERTLGTVADAILCGEYETALVAWAMGVSKQPVVLHLGKSDFQLPYRQGLPGLDRYARLEDNGIARLAGAVEASHGCRHRCRHCPIPAVYDGRLRIVGRETVLGDIDQLVAMGAEHITFTDADFLNAPP
ncbi:MAG TPA: cobalamin-dependent protein, partial [Acidimicrobiia bacterium]|nr:cobalamin-dependent protein [Acidimicrobiia bacterium]